MSCALWRGYLTTTITTASGACQREGAQVAIVYSEIIASSVAHQGQRNISNECK